MNDSGNSMHSATAQPIPPFAQMMQLLSGFQVSQALYTVAELDVATILMKGPRTIDALAALTATPSAGTADLDAERVRPSSAAVTSGRRC